MAAEPVLALHDIQANSVIGFRKPNQSFAFLRLEPGPAAAGRALRWLGDLAPQLSAAREVLAHNRAFRAARQRGRAGRAATLALGAENGWPAGRTGQPLANMRPPDDRPALPAEQR